MRKVNMKDNVHLGEVKDVESEGPNFSRSEKELRHAFDELNHLGATVAIFGSARIREGDAHYQLAYDTGKVFAESGYHVLTGGGPGAMEAANKAAFEVEGVESVGVGIELPHEQNMNKFCTIPIEMYYFFNRKVVYVRHSRAFVCLPGGVGTLDEMFEVLTLVQTEKIKRFPVVLVGKDYWQGLIQWMQDRPIAEGKMLTLEEEGIFLVDTPEEALQAVEDFWKIS